MGVLKAHCSLFVQNEWNHEQGLKQISPDEH